MVGEEIAQEVFLRLAGRYDEVENPDAYLRTAVVNAARSWHRSAARRSARGHLAVVGEGDEVLVVDELLESLARLPYEQRAVLVLRYWADGDEASIAAALGCRPVTVRTRARRGLAVLRRALEEERFA